MTLDGKAMIGAKHFLSRTPMMAILRTRLLRTGLAIALVNASAAQAQQRYAGVVEQILDAWKTSDVVCLGDLSADQEGGSRQRDVPDSVVGPDMAAFRARMGPELDRRAKILSDAVKLRQQRP